MNKTPLFIAISALVFTTTAVSAKSSTEDDRAAIIAAYDAIKNKKFEIAVSETNAVIERFEEGKQNDSVYLCASGSPDVLSTLFGAAVKADKGEQDEGKTTTVAVSDNICSAYFFKGFALIDLRNREEALPNLKMAVQMDPDNQHYLNQLGEWYKAGGDWQKSLEIFRKASETVDLSTSLMEDKEQSKQIMDQIRCRSYRGIAFNQVEMRNWDEARSAIDKCLKLIPNDPGSMRELQYITAQSDKE